VATNGRLKGIRILVVEDDRDAREIVQFILEQNGAVVASANAVPEALDLYPKFTPNIIVADIGMPDYNGYALIASVRQEDARLGRVTPAIALTAFASPADRLQALSAGFQEYIVKPFDPAELIAAISRLAGPGPANSEHSAA
jgi:CheY-like chemotaxis protein